MFVNRNGLLLLFASMLTCAASVVQAQEKYAFIVGVKNYDPEFFQNLQYTEIDATRLAGQLEGMGYSTVLMTSSQTNPQHKPTTPEKILRLLDGQLQAITKDDTLIISLSGHGIQFKGESALEGGGKETYFVPEEGSLENKSSLLPIVKEIISRVDQCKAERKLVLIDACRNEVLSTAGDKSAGKIDLGTVHENLQVVPKGMAVVFSCSSGQKSWEIDELKHSVFTSFVLEYLAGKAGEDFYNDRQADVSGMIGYVRRKTHQYVLKNITPSGQYPEVVGSVEQWPIGRIGPPLKFATQFMHQMVYIPEGSFLMGSSDSEAGHQATEYQHQVEITRPFYISAHEITVDQFRAFVKSTERVMPTREFGYDQQTDKFTYGDFNWENPGWEQSGDDPVVLVSWQDATDYCQWLSTQEGRVFRLPTEAEWEYACRAGSDETWPFEIADLHEYANCIDEQSNEMTTDGFEFTAPVGQFKPNRFGLFDMLGNVEEWCHDFYGKDYFRTSPLQDPKGPADGRQRVIKGGSFNKEPSGVRPASRAHFSSDIRYPTIGFRIVCEVEQ